LNRHYEAWTRHYTKGPLLTVESDTLDFVNNKKDLAAVVGMIRKKLRTKL
jgi:deoxyadenosine/deoxycytidine kinase